MAHGTPDWVRMVLVAVTVENLPIAAAAATENAAGAAGNYSGGDLAYQTVASWTVSANTVGDLKEILFLSDNYAKTELKITVGAVVWATGWSPQASMPVIFEDLKLVAGTVVKVEAQSTDATVISVDAIIVGKEIG